MKMGVIICTCGNTLSDKIDIDRLIDFAKGLEGVSIVKKVEMFCKNYEEVVEELKGKVDRLLFAGCSERSSLTFNEDKVAQILEKMGLNRVMFEVANIREQCAWIHEDRDGATRKALDQLMMAYVKLRSNRPPGDPIKLEKRVLVVGGGVAGMQCAIDLAKAGIDVVLVEKNPYLGGHTAQIPLLFQCEGWSSMCTSECIVPVIARETTFNDKITVITNAEVKEVEKVNGNFLVTIEQKPQFVDPNKCVSCGKCSEVCPVEVPNQFDLGFGKRKAIDKDFTLAIPDSYNILEEHCNKCGECFNVCPTNAINLNAKPSLHTYTFGAVVIATGFGKYDLNKIEKYNYKHPNVVTTLELERLMAKNFNGKTLESIVYILCSGSRSEEGVSYCSKLCCPIMSKLTMRLSTIYQETELTVIYKDLRTYGRAFEEFRKKAEAQAVEFVKAEVEKVVEENEKLKVITNEGEFYADLVVLAEPLVPSSARLMKTFGLPLDQYGFPIEFQPRIINPSESYVDRVFVAGTAKGFKDVQESVESGSAVAMKVYEALMNDKVLKYVSHVDKDKCIGCGICVAVCPHNAIKMEDRIAKSDPAFCKGCGLCISACPVNAIQLINFEDEQLFNQIDVAFKHAKSGEPRILALLCYWCSYAAADLMGVKGLKLPANFRSIRVRCSASVKNWILLKALLENKVDGIIVAGCPPKNCHHLHGNYMAEKRINSLKETLSMLGIGEKKLRYEYVGVAMWNKLANIIKTIDNSLRE